MTTVREATFTVMRELGMTRVFANPGSTEVAFLTDLPDDLEFVLALHEGSVVGMATGHAIATSRPALVVLHTTAGLGNAVGALATARVNRAPLVVVVGQQDRRHLALEPFLAGHLDRLAEPYPVWVDQPALAQDVPAAVRRAWHEAQHAAGPAVVVVPMDDWSAQTDPSLGLGAPRVVVLGPRVSHPGATDVAARLDAAGAPVLVVGAGADDPACWAALVTLAERLGCPVWQESFGARAGFPQDHPQFAGHLPAARSRLRAALAGHDLALVVGTGAFRQYPFEDGPLTPEGMTVVVVSAHADDLHHSAADLAVLAAPAELCREVSGLVAERQDRFRAPAVVPVAPPAPGAPLRAEHVFALLADALPADTVLVEETPSSRPDLHRLLPARAPGGFVSAAMGGLGFGLPAAVGLRMGAPSRPVVAVLGDGSTLYAIQGLWSAAHYGIGLLAVVLSNGRYAIMDRLAEQRGGVPPWPAFDEVDVCGLSLALGCPAERVETYDELARALAVLVPGLADRRTPHLLDVTVVPDPHVAP
ncbi:thiamine pyrophosphate-dependent enzyme [Cellulomonas sp. KRMCY2]|uniref:thiamine pyrophosphate-dependent enzyme n=1 Tax=Cellulomonas sp. KRMCY2 TaxID=1304865 RepID=UPI00045EB331|nr:thiamine pyrophosphate-dependent enzyme [Cellulomonas sp. KRMCY2]